MIYTCARVSIEDLYELNPDIDLGECLFKDENSLYIQKMIKNSVDIENDVINSETLKQLQLLTEISEEITDIIYIVMDNKNS